MNAVIVNISDVVEYRVDMVHDFLISRGWDVKVLVSDYMHIEKKKRVVKKEDYTAINTIPYKKNLSFKRLYSHYDYAKKVKRILSDMEFDLLYIVVPANSLAAVAKEYNKKDNVKIIIDIIDLWPESIPIKAAKYFPFTLWSDIRNRNLKYADFIITECDLYQNVLKKWIKNKKVKTVYWCHKKNDTEYHISPLQHIDKISLCYLGSINNIIDIGRIADIVSKLRLKRPVTVNIIGAGEKKEEFIESLKRTGAEVIDHGKIYDYHRKKEILDTCHYGINIMKKGVCVGLSMKSVDYLEMGLPVLNSLNGDTHRLIAKYKCGFNIKDIEQITDYDLQMRKNARKCYEEELSYHAFIRNFQEILNSL